MLFLKNKVWFGLVTGIDALFLKNKVRFGLVIGIDAMALVERLLPRMQNFRTSNPDRN